MAIKVFSKRHQKEGQLVTISKSVRNRIWQVIIDSDPSYNPNGFNNDYTLSWEELPDRLKKEHGWEDLRAYKSQSAYVTLSSAGEFIKQGVPRFVFDGLEIFYDLLVEAPHSEANPAQYQRKINDIFDDANMPWRLLDGRIIKIDSKWLEEEIHAKAVELLSIRGFDGALAEFQQARFDLSNGDVKGAMQNANLALESTIKTILNIQQARPGELFRKLMDSGLIPDYHEGFLKAFEQHILLSVPTARNFEKGVGHGQGADVSEPSKSLAELAVNLSGVMMLYLLKCHLEKHPIAPKATSEPEAPDDDVPF